ncbi:phosphofructokinase domain-containing protein [Blastocladiella britannica]|nr:phosphofructokinase domain-containing protein [Blastocladiella britannica]
MHRESTTNKVCTSNELGDDPQPFRRRHHFALCEETFNQHYSRNIMSQNEFGSNFELRVNGKSVSSELLVSPVPTVLAAAATLPAAARLPPLVALPMRSSTPMPTLSDPHPFAISALGVATVPTPLEVASGSRFTQDGDLMLYKPYFSDPVGHPPRDRIDDDGTNADLARGVGSVHLSPDTAESHGGDSSYSMYKRLPGHDAEMPLFLERSGPREKLFFQPNEVVAGIVTCGGLCPGLNNVIRALVCSLHFRYHVKSVLGFRYGYEGLNPTYGHMPMVLTPGDVKDAHRFGGSLLGTSRGPQDINVMVDYLVSLGVTMLFTVGGDGTQKGAHAIAIEAERRGINMAVVGVPKTIDNDVAYCAKTFGFESAVAMALDPIAAAHEEARSARGGIGIVKLMGRDSGFIALHATLASGDVNLLLIPEVPFSLERVYAIVEDRLATRSHIVIVVAEGAGQDVIAAAFHGEGKAVERDASGNVKLQDVGAFLRDMIGAHLKKVKVDHTIKYLEPTYHIRSQPACASDAVFTVSLAQQAVHAAMAGKTDCVIGLVQDEFVLVPIQKAVERRKKVDPTSSLYQTVLDHTGMPRDLVL